MYIFILIAAVSGFYGQGSRQLRSTKHSTWGCSHKKEAGSPDVTFLVISASIISFFPSPVNNKTIFLDCKILAMPRVSPYVGRRSMERVILCCNDSWLSSATWG